MKVLALNGGSSSLKLAVFDGDRVVGRDGVDGEPAGAQARDLLERTLDAHPDVTVVGHRLVHGGPEVGWHTEVDDDVRRRLEGGRSIDPLHVVPALEVLDLVRGRLPDARHVACLDSAFHATMPEVARTYAVPRRWRELGMRRYGFHGLSYAWARDRAADLLGRSLDDLAMVLVHAGGGTSTCAVLEGASVWTSMGMTSLAGAVMVGRSGSVDPGALLWLQSEHRLSPEELRRGLEQDGGMTGLSDGLGGDTRDLHRAASQGHPGARLALDVFVFRLRQEVAAAAACLPRLDALVFTGDIGEDDPEIRQQVCDGLATLGLDGPLDPGQDEDQLIRIAAGRPTVVLVHLGEEQQMARICHEVLGR
ncbi:MAG: acetate/propionate family kinase [Mycobacteriales bacterium]